ncbi:DUF3305 domain-containing protein [Pseudoruegeria sp. HB172150]|uniref:DUF3305 domain-containing protein n=1 Tax=Pseudoruegeria sp. HB172150 TaxID=2721164 RepID=UPI0020A68A38|nr:DUF3305 domain-containing protein [Pseudoruegeria sp. HB172150]
MTASDRYQAMPLGVVVRRSPGATRWAKWAWTVTGILPGAGPAEWRVLREDDDTIDYHATTGTLELFAGETEAYLTAISGRIPSLYVVMRRTGRDDRPLKLVLVTASAYEAQDYCDSGEEIVEKVPMPEGLIAWIRDFTDAHHVDEEFRKRRRDRKDTSLVEDGIGDARIVQTTDVYRSPRSARQGRLQ